MYLLKTIMTTAVFCFTAFVHAEVNINTATMQQFTELHNIGSVKAAAIIEYRDKHGHFERVDDLLKVNGIGLAILEANRDMLSVGTDRENEVLPIEHVMPTEEVPIPKVTRSRVDKEN